MADLRWYEIAITIVAVGVVGAVVVTVLIEVSGASWRVGAAVAGGVAGLLLEPMARWVRRRRSEPEDSAG